MHTVILNNQANDLSLITTQQPPAELAFNELQAQILTWITHPSDISSCALVSRDWYDLTQIAHPQIHADRREIEDVLHQLMNIVEYKDGNTRYISEELGQEILQQDLPTNEQLLRALPPRVARKVDLYRRLEKMTHFLVAKSDSNANLDMMMRRIDHANSSNVCRFLVSNIAGTYLKKCMLTSDFESEISAVHTERAFIAYTTAGRLDDALEQLCAFGFYEDPSFFNALTTIIVAARAFYEAKRDPDGDFVANISCFGESFTAEQIKAIAKKDSTPFHYAAAIYMLQHHIKSFKGFDIQRYESRMAAAKIAKNTDQPPSRIQWNQVGGSASLPDQMELD